MEIQTLLPIVVSTVLFAVLAPVAGCLLAGLDRKASARMQGRVGPRLLQPLYDVCKLMGKEDAAVNGAEGVYILCALACTLLAGGIFFAGGNFLMCAFMAALGALFFILAAYSSRSPYAEAGAAREVVQVMAYEPMVLVVGMAMFLAAGSFDVGVLITGEVPIALPCLFALAGLLYVLTIKLRKSPFDLSMSHHAHQDLVRGMVTEMSGPTLAKVEVMHWCENVLFLGWVGMFFVCSNPFSWAGAVVAALVVYFFEIWIDNNFARVKWQAMLGSAWCVALVCGVVNLTALVL